MKKGPIIAVSIWLVIAIVVAVVIKFVVMPQINRDKLEQTGSNTKYEHELTWWGDGFSGYAVARSPEFAANLRDSGIKMSFKDDQADTKARIKALRDGKADFAFFTLDSFITNCYELGELPASIILVGDETQGADAILAWQDSIGNIQDLNNPNARIWGISNSPAEFLPRTMVANFNLPRLSENWFEGADSPDDLFSKLRGSRGEPVAVAMWEPWVSKALEIDGIHSLITSANVKGFIVDVIVVRRDLITSNYELVKDVAEAYLRAQYTYQSKTNGLQQLVIDDAKILGDKLSDESANNIVNGIVWKNTLENYAHFGLLPRHETGGLDHIEDMIRNILRVLVATGKMPRSNSIAGQTNLLYFDQILAELRREDFHPGRAVSVVTGPATLGDLNSSMQMEAIRGVDQLRKLQDSEWDRLIAVGEFQAKPISFGRGKSTLHIQAERDLRSLVDKLKSFPRYYIQVVGSAAYVPPSPDASDEDIEAINKANLELAQARAETVANRLQSMGIHENRIRHIAATQNGSGGSSSVMFIVAQEPY